MASQDVTRVSSKRLTYNGWLDSNEDPKAYADHVNPVWVKLLDTLGMNAKYTRATDQSSTHQTPGRFSIACQDTVFTTWVTTVHSWLPSLWLNCKVRVLGCYKAM
jgi:hypothetical protein